MRKGRDWSPRGPEGIPFPFEKGQIIVPEHLQYPEGALEVYEVLEKGSFKVFPVGGGSVMTFGPKQMEKYKFRRVTQDELDVPWRRGRFSIGFVDDRILEGWTTGELWNGWATPYFEKNEAVEIMKESKKLHQEVHQKFKWSYDAKKDFFKYQSENDEEPEKVSGMQIMTPEGLKTVYGIGAYSWTWQEE